MTIRTCASGHASLDAANWSCPWCEIERLRAERDALQKKLTQLLEGDAMCAELSRAESQRDALACECKQLRALLLEARDEWYRLTPYSDLKSRIDAAINKDKP